jgi:phosphoserine phosphatase
MQQQLKRSRDRRFAVQKFHASRTAAPRADELISWSDSAPIVVDNQFEHITSSRNGLQSAGARTVTVTGTLVVMARSVAETTN